MGGCTYSFSTEPGPMESTTIPSSWQCPFESTHGQYCAFHTEEPDPDTQRELLQSALRVGDSEQISPPNVDIVGATINLAINSEKLPRIEKTNRIRFHNCEFTEPVDLRETQIDGNCSFAGSVFHDEFLFEEATVRGELNLSDTEYTTENSIILNGIRCERSLRAENLKLSKVHIEHALIGGDCRFDSVEINELSLARTRTEGKLVIRGDVRLIRLMQAVVMDRGGTTFRNGENATANIDFGDFGQIIATKCFIEGSAEIGPAIQIDFSEAKVTGRVRTSGSDRLERCDFSGSEISGGLDILASSLGELTLGGSSDRNTVADIDGRLMLDITLRGDIDLSRANLDRVEFTVNEVESTDSPPVIDCTQARIETGKISSKTDTKWEVDFTNATMVDIIFTGWDEDTGLLEAIQLFDTAFDGFDFERPTNRSLFDQNGWAPITQAARKQHKVTSDAVISSSVKAKNGANAIGAKRIAGRFFLHEMRARNRYAWDQARDSSGISGLGSTVRAIKMSALGTTTGYGEQPSRVLAWSVGVIGLFAIVYYFTVSSLAGNPSVLDATLLSIQSFSTLVLGAPPQAQQPVLRLLTAVEGFVGAFFVALFVFTMTRTLYR